MQCCFYYADSVLLGSKPLHTTPPPGYQWRIFRVRVIRASGIIIDSPSGLNRRPVSALQKYYTILG